jgi:putative transposase
LLEWERDELPLAVQAQLLELNRSGLYYRPAQASADEIRLKHRIDEVYTAYPFFGSRKIAAFLREKGFEVSRKAVRRHMHEMGIQAIYPGPNLSKRDLQNRIFPYLLRDLAIERPDQVWGIDITYIRLQKAWMYLVAIVDWHSRYVVEWELDQTLEIPFVLEAVNRAFARSIPEIFNSDQGSHFTSPQYTELLKGREVKISMDGKGRAIDNIFTERFWRSLKYEEVYLNDYATPREARQGIRRYIQFYNTERPHQSLGYRTPAKLYHKKECLN